jgi:hypothetical protein
MAGYKRKTPYTKRASARKSYKGNKQAKARTSFAPKAMKYKSDHQQMQCASFTRKSTTLGVANDKWSSGTLCNLQAVPAKATDGTGGDIGIAAVIALDPRNPLLASAQHASYSRMFNEWCCKAIYIDILISKELRDNCEQLFLLTEKGDPVGIESETSMCSDVNAVMYQLGNNTQKITFKYVPSTPNERLMKRTSDVGAGVTANELTYLKLLIKGKNHTGDAIPIGDLQVALRTRMFMSYRDMKVTHLTTAQAMQQ